MSDVLMINKLSKKYGSTLIFNNFDINFSMNSFVSILGPSGCGKSTLLKIIAGIDNDYSGKIIREMELKDINLVFQKPILLHWLNIHQNLELVGKLKNNSISIEIIKQALCNVGLKETDSILYPKDISGGMKARVAIARSLICESSTILLDEPFNGLDFMIKAKLINLFYNSLINRKNVIMATHNIDDALLLSNRIILLSSEPAEIIGDIKIDLPYPRKKDEIFINKLNEIEKTFQHYHNHKNPVSSSK